MSQTTRQLEGRVAVVTGGANGIGRACAERFADEGAKLVVADILKDAGEKVVAGLEARGCEAVFAPLDAADIAQNRALAEFTAQRFGRIDVLLTASGISHPSYRSGDVENDKKVVEESQRDGLSAARKFVDLELADWQKLLDVNLTGTLLAIQSCLPHMLENGGSIITVGSVASKRPEPGFVAYNVSKAGVWMLTKSLAPVLGPSGIRINAIGPGYIRTNMTQFLEDQPEVVAALEGTLPLGRLGVPNDIAGAALFLASDDSSYFTGEILHPAGGHYLG